jgi:L,D-peptidoglycan transpeptidase YkuD (ErfK/YbiS/YcfS/YnhG family)
MHILIKNKYLFFKHYRIKCAIGKRGIGIKKREGDLITPKGQFKIKYILYRNDKIKKFVTKIRKKKIQKKMGWCDDPNSKYYNKLIKLPFNYKFEKLFRKDNIYDILFVLNYNMNPIIKNKGSAIFVHLAKKNYSSTQGCIAIKKIDMFKLIKDIKKNTTVKII